MCMGGGKTPAPVTPPAPPPPPPVLEQSAPQSAAPTVAEQNKNKASGTKQYRTSLSIGGTDGATNNTGLGINS
jgi:hypothetical protein